MSTKRSSKKSAPPSASASASSSLRSSTASSSSNASFHLFKNQVATLSTDSSSTHSHSDEQNGTADSIASSSLSSDSSLKSSSSSSSSAASFALSPTSLSSLLSLLQSLTTSSTSLSPHLSTFLSRLSSLPISAGISFLNLPPYLLLQYEVRLVFLMLQKLRGSYPQEGLSEEDTVKQLVEIRTVMEKIRPMEKKLKYMIEKVVKAGQARGEGRREDEADGEGEGKKRTKKRKTEAANGGEDEGESGASADSFLSADPLSFRPNPAALVDDLSSSAPTASSSSSSSSTSTSSDGLYRPPKVTPVDYEESERSTARARREADAARAKLQSSRLLSSLYEEISDRPEEIRSADGAEVDQEEQERTRFEEDNFVRLSLSKQDKAKMKKKKDPAKFGGAGGDFDDFDNFDDLLKGGMPKRKDGVQDLMDRFSGGGKGMKRKMGSGGRAADDTAASMRELFGESGGGGGGGGRGKSKGLKGKGKKGGGGSKRR